MTVSVTMLQTRVGEDGSLWTVAGSPYNASLDFAYFLIGNQFATESVPGTLPVGRNSPQRPAQGLYAELLSGSAFTAPRAENRRSPEVRDGDEGVGA